MSLTSVWTQESKIFKDETKLYPEYVPETLPHRSEHLLELGRAFKSFVTKPGSVPTRVVLVGPSGTGKTVTAMKFGKALEGMVRAGRLPVRIHFVIVNCYIYKTAFAIYKELARSLGITVPRRGFSKSEVLRLLADYLVKNDEYVILTIDEADFLVSSSGAEALYVLSRLSEAHMLDKARIAMIIIFRNPLSTLNLSDPIRSTLAHYTIKFDPYTKREIEDIIWARVEEGAIYDSAISDEVVDTIGTLVGYDTGGTGDARLALEVLLNAGRIAESKNKSCIEVEDVRVAFTMVMPFPRNLLEYLSLHEALLLYALTLLLGERKYVNWVTTGVLEETYRALCEDFGIEPKSHTTIWEYIQRLRNRDIIKTQVSTRGRGRTTQISMPRVPLGQLKQELERIIEQKLKRARRRLSSS